MQASPKACQGMESKIKSNCSFQASHSIAFKPIDFRSRSACNQEEVVLALEPRGPKPMLLADWRLHYLNFQDTNDMVEGRTSEFLRQRSRISLVY